MFYELIAFTRASHVSHVKEIVKNAATFLLSSPTPAIIHSIATHYPSPKFTCAQFPQQSFVLRFYASNDTRASLLRQLRGDPRLTRFSIVKLPNDKIYKAPNPMNNFPENSLRPMTSSSSTETSNSLHTNFNNNDNPISSLPLWAQTIKSKHSQALSSEPDV